MGELDYKVEHWRIDAFELWFCRRLLRVPRTAKTSNQSSLKISPGCSLEGLMLKLKLQSFGHLMRRPDSFEKTNLDSIFKSRDITLPTKVPIVKAMVFPVVMCGCQIWTIKKAEHRKIDTFELWCCWRRLLRVPWTARRSNQSILNELNPKYSLEGLMLKLKLQCSSHMMQKVDL